ncbi:MAG: MFS transporter [Defluviitaleaceae bacterium]|nr:MFS transporter [Defluviitaleaceae bacterium]MCL2239209.1 MFS transporter [Defluviitaleaceae bacterium]MCL2240318.1 MFS transporter [Defluviitaleaceae bacterium]
MTDQNKKRAFGVFLAATALTALAAGLSEGLYSNFYFEVYHVTPAQRGFIEFPREIPGLIAVIVISLLAFLGEVKLAIVAQILTIVGLLLLGVFTPPFGIMLIFLFINSMGMHLYMPLKDSIALNIIGTENTGRKFGLVNAVRTGTAFLVGLIVFIGFRTGVFHFEGGIRFPFLIACVFVLGVIVLLLIIRRLIGDPRINTGKGRFLFRREYKFYYILASLHGAHKQIAGVFGPWVLIDILLRQADTLAILGMIGSFLGIFFIPFAGRMTDRLGVKAMMYVEGFSFIFIYILFGVMSGGLDSGRFAMVGIPVILVYILFIIDRMTMQLGMIRTLYLRTIAIDPSEISPTLSTGMSIDHVISIVGALLGGLAWAAWGPQYVFFIAAVLSLGNVLVALNLPKREKPDFS